MSATPYLSSLGVPVLLQTRPPTNAGFPLMFNSGCKHLWDEAIREFTPTDSPITDWYNVITKFIDKASAAGRYPFTGYHQSINDLISDRLRNARRAVVRFMDKSKILKLATVRNTHRRVSMTDTGFVLTVYGDIFLKDPTFPQWLLQMPYPRFDIVRSIDNRWDKNLGDNVTFFARNEGALAKDRWFIGYDIKVDLFPEVPNQPLPSKGELERFVLNVLWMPVLRSHRPQGLSHKLL